MMEHTEFVRQSEVLSRHVTTLQRHLGAHMAHQKSSVDDMVEDLHMALEGLQGANDELRQQNEALAVAREEVEAERQRYVDLFEFAPDGYLVTDVVGSIQEANRAAAALLAVPQDRLVGKPIAVFVAPTERQTFRTHLAGAAQWPARQDWEIWLQPRQGRPVYTALSVAPINDRRGELCGLRWLLRDLTARQQSAEALSASEHRLRAIFEQRHQRAGILSPEGILVDVSQTALDFSGLQRADVIGRPFWETGWWCHAPDLQQRLRAAIAEAGQGRVVQFEATHPRPDGTLATVDFSLRPIIDDTGTVVFLVPESQDITAGKQAEAALTARIRQMAAVHHVTTEVTRELHLPTLLRLIIQHAVTLVGATHGIVYGWDECTQRLIPQAWTDTALSPWLPEIHLGLGEGASGHAAQLRQRVCVPDYRQVPYAHPRLRECGVRAALAEPLLDRDSLLGVMALYHTGEELFDLERDGESLSFFASQAVVALRHAQLLAEAQAQTTRLQAVIETAVDAILIIDEHGMVEMCNPAIESLLGYHPTEVIGHNVNHLMPAPDREAHGAYLARYLGTGERYVIGLGREVVGQRKDGTLVPLRLSVSETFLGTQRRFVGILHDITPYKQAEAALQHARDALEERVQERTMALQEANADIRRFAFIVSHDLRAPLTNLKGFARELRDSCGLLCTALPAVLDHLDEAQREPVTRALQEDMPEALNFMDTSVTRMGRLIETILTLARVGRQEFRLEPIATAELVQEILETLAYQIAQGQVQVEVGTLPVVSADRTALSQIFGNLLANAVAYLEPGRPGVLRITAVQQSDITVFQVQDNGRGIAADDIPKIFEPFRRVGRQDVPGDGMGLAYVQRLVQRLGGTLTCQSTLGVGTLMAFTIPQQRS